MPTIFSGIKNACLDKFVKMNFPIKPLIMKVLISAISLLMLIVGLNSCLPEQKTETDKFDNELHNFNKSMDNIGQTMDLVDAMQAEVDIIERKRALGEITDEEADDQLNEVKETYGRVIARRSNVNPATSLPEWAKRLGLTEPQGLLVDADYSQLTSVNNPDEGFNSVLLVYNGDYTTSMREAEIIAKRANIPLSKDYTQAVELAKTYSSKPIRGIAYMNFDPFVSDASFNISITVDETGMLTISAVDVNQMKRQFEKTDNEE